MNKDIKLVDFQLKDIEFLASLLLETWDYLNQGSYEERIKVTELYILEEIMVCDYIKILKVDDNIKGIIAGYFHKQKPNQYLDIFKERKESYFKDKTIAELYKYNQVIFAGNALIEKRHEIPESEIRLLFISSDTRGLNLGKYLVEEFINEATNKNCLSVSLYSDKDCNYKFYERLGFEVVDSDSLEYNYFGNDYHFENFLFKLEIK